MEINKEVLIGLGFEVDKDRFKQEVFRLEWLPFCLEYIEGDSHLDGTEIDPYYGVRNGMALFTHPRLRTIKELNDLCKMFGAVLKH